MYNKKPSETVLYLVIVACVLIITFLYADNKAMKQTLYNVKGDTKYLERIVKDIKTNKATFENLENAVDNLVQDMGWFENQ